MDTSPRHEYYIDNFGDIWAHSLERDTWWLCDTEISREQNRPPHIKRLVVED